MVESVTKWQAKDGALFDTENAAINHDLIVDVADFLVKTARDHQTYLDLKSALAVADVLVMTDAYYRLDKVFKGNS